MTETEAWNQGFWSYDGPYETFAATSEPPDYCQYRIPCNLCKEVLGTKLCHTDIDFWEDPDDPAIQYGVPKTRFEGVEFCTEFEE
ncbi:MAG: hypothetical protein AAGD07_23220 [Planctomycetota bacterium]